MLSTSLPLLRPYRLASLARLLPSRPCSSLPQPEVVIPPRVERGPTDILKALAGTVARDYTAPHYKFHDDPWLTPYKNNTKRDFALAKEAGRKSARYILNRHPDLFEHNRIYAEPPITAFQPRAAYNRDNVTIELLDNLVSSHQVGDAMSVYDLLKEKKKSVPASLKQALLELVAFHNEEEAEEEGFEARGVLREKPSKWVQGGFVEKLYSEDSEEGSTAAGRLALLVGYARHGNAKGAKQVWDQCREGGDVLPLEAHHALLSSYSTEGVEKSMVFLREVLGGLKEQGLAPSTETLVAVLGVLQHTARGQEHQQSCNYALDCVAEFRAAGVAMSLGVYKTLLDIFVQQRSELKSSILVDIVKEVEGKEYWPAVTEEDFNFFPKAMQVAMGMSRPALAWQLNELLLTGKNMNLLCHHNNEQMYYNYFLSNVLQNDSFEHALELYNKVTPHLWSPGGIFFRNLLHAVHSHGATNHLAKVFDDMMLSDMGGANKETCFELLHQVMQMLAANDPGASEFAGLGEVWADIARRVFAFLEDSKDNRSFGLRFNLLAPSICNLCIDVQMSQGQYEQAVKVFRFCQEEMTVMPGQLGTASLARLLDQSVSLEEASTVVEVVAYSLAMGVKEAPALAVKASQGLQLLPEQREHLNKLFATDPSWKPV